MASCNRFINRTSLQALKSAIKSNGRTPSATAAARTPLFSSPTAPCRRLSAFLSRSPAELGCVQSLLPLHSAVAVARMTSCLSSNASTCRALSQGSLCRTSPGL